MGPALVTQNATNGLAWAQHWPQSMQPMVLHGPSAGRKVCYGCSCMGPVLAPMHATEGLAWTQCCPPQCATDDLAQAQPWPLSMLLMVLCRPITDPKACCRWSCMGPVLVPWNATDGLAWSHCWPPKCATDDLSWAHPWPPSMLPMVLCWPGTSPKACYRWYCMGPSLAPTHATDGLAWAQC